MIRINLLKPETKDKEPVLAPGAIEEGGKAGPKGPNVGNLIFLALVIALGAGYFFQKKAMDQERNLLAAARQEKAKLQYVEAKLEEQRAVRESLDRKITLIENLNAQRDLAPRLMDEISRRLPDWVWLTEVVYDAKGISIKGRALSNNLIADYIGGLEASPQIMNVNLIASTQKTLQGDQYLEFQLRAVIERKPEPVPPPGTAAPGAKPAATKGVQK
ncbi:MAG TPA: PilN domain-containing protein [Candidatus Aminicenantes bacterium]|nr:PilN domain-containing protein [Candidatus Aminicenantes bacterium]HRY65045.1 PilN domain-containing protein [Candidatus Aminicenantes bacterium]HRZ71958.1 PilN domain-containing protein [Candidatus Aminicenantes bacterium]